MRSTITVCIAATLIWSVVGGVLCAPVQPSEEIVLASKVVARITARGDFGSVSERAAAIDKRITQAISVEDVGSPRMSIGQSGGQPTIVIGKTMLMKVYAEDAARYKVSPAQLARTWKDNFAKQFPLAEPVIHMSTESASSELARAASRTAQAAKVSVPSADWAIVAVLLDDLGSARAIPPEQLADALPGLSALLYGHIVASVLNSHSDKILPTPPHQPGACPQAGGCPACCQAKTAVVQHDDITCPPQTVQVPRNALRRIEGGLKLMAGVDESRFVRDRNMVALTILRAVRAELTPPAPPQLRGPAATP